MNKTFNYLGHKWKIKGKSSLGPKYIAIKRTNFLSDLKKKGQVITAIDVLKKDLK